MSELPPLLEACRRVAECCPALTVRMLGAGEPAPGRDWVPATDFADRMPELIAGEAGRIRAEHGCAVPPHVAAARLLHHYLWSVCLLASGPWYLTGRVPELGHDRLWLAPQSGELAFRPGNELDDASDRATSGDERLRAVVAAHAAPVLAAFRPVAKRGSRSLWGMVTDDLVSGLWYLGRMLGREEDAVARAERLLPGGTGPLPGGAQFRRLAGTADREHLTRTRLGCCLYYAVRPEDTCLTCPRTCDAERVRRLEE
ncbi:(2Fe-2S)-binding protein [Kitasatospora sp. NBC_01266]|uniref:(2Fe-2S)-binding protein n=1 Tax=Kitasatospora sp. NBC_01266 TaxID=2903572 RepID=UPI002E3119E4|nr:(2Fe-2S)-binding protein [Kitasatospora sp. NBC_01266]